MPKKGNKIQCRANLLPVCDEKKSFAILLVIKNKQTNSDKTKAETKITPTAKEA